MKHSQQIIRVARTGYGLLLEQNGEYRVCSSKVSWLDLSSSPSMFQDAMKFFKKGITVEKEQALFLVTQCKDPLVDVKNQAVLAFGVTFHKSEVARDDEFKAGGDSSASGQTETETEGRQLDTPYTRVGERGNPAELFCKAKKPNHLFGPGDDAGIRSIEDMPAIIEGEEKILPPWNVHEPEIATVVTPCGHPVAFSLGLDMSCRRDEGISALLLTKAKIFPACAGFGHWFTIPENPLEFWKSIELESWVERSEEKIWPIEGEPTTMSATQCRRSLTELCMDVLDAGMVEDGESAIFMSGTGIVPAPGDTFSLLPGDKIMFRSEQLGELDCGVALVPRPRRNHVAEAKASQS